MTALTQNKVVLQRAGNALSGLLGASQTIFVGSMLMRNAAGAAIKGATATGAIGIGVAVEAAVSTDAGETRVDYETGVFAMANSASADEITAAEIGDVCFIVDDQTVAKTDGSGTRSPAGIVVDVDAQGVWVRFDEALTKAANVADAAFALASV